MKQYICPKTDKLSVEVSQLMSGSGSTPGWNVEGEGDAGEGRVAQRLSTLYI